MHQVHTIHWQTYVAILCFLSPLFIKIRKSRKKNTSKVNLTVQELSKIELDNMVTVYLLGAAIGLFLNEILTYIFI